eukprot:366059-Chlamydomonas_euryale.AAC.1
MSADCQQLPADCQQLPADCQQLSAACSCGQLVGALAYTAPPAGRSIRRHSCGQLVGAVAVAAADSWSDHSVTQLQTAGRSSSRRGAATAP